MAYIEIGPAPADEDCVQVGTPDYVQLARVECSRFIELIKKRVGKPPEGVRLAVKSSPHDFGDYLEVVCYFEPDNKEAVEYAYRCESEAPTRWKV